MERRQYLASLSAAATLAIAGCQGQSDDPSTTDSTTNATDSQDPTTSSTTDDGPLAFGDELSLSGEMAFAVTSATAHASVLTRAEGDVDVVAPEEGCYAVFTLEADGIDDYEAFVSEHVTLVINDEEYGDPVFPLGGDRSEFQAAFPVPADATPYTASVTVETDATTATWELDARAIGGITQAVDYAVTSVEVPDSVEGGAEFDVEFTVENAAADPLRFLATLSAASTSRLTVEVPGSTTETFTRTATAPSDADEVEVVLDYGATTETQTVAVA